MIYIYIYKYGKPVIVAEPAATSEIFHSALPLVVKSRAFPGQNLRFRSRLRAIIKLTWLNTSMVVNSD